ncbi:MAG TPA: SUMF1/EgtB/PvdO family nonheme iron enzyme [Bacteroidia bacterium]|nr:SUMF1/EgtB/PvdO family nonheme iron enzyme [Bacteroidia bacterium]
MKTNKFAIPAALIFILFISSFKNPYVGLDSSTIEKSVVEISEEIFCSKYEVSNQLYNTFLHDLKSNNRLEDFGIAQIDSTGWVRKPVYFEAMVHEYHRAEKYANYPVVNISYEGAALFCDWLTKKYNSFPDRKFKNVEFYLPGKEEWTLAASGKSKDAVYSCGNSLVNEKGMQMANYRRTDIPLGLDEGDKTIDIGSAVSVGEILAPVKSYWENDLGVYNLSGNAAEMISEKGIMKGGSFKDESEQLKIDSQQIYTEPASFIGFRYFMRKK